MHSKMENKENELSRMNMNTKLNRTSSCRDNQRNIKSMSGIRKLYTLKANNSNQRLENKMIGISASNTINKHPEHRTKVRLKSS